MQADGGNSVQWTGATSTRWNRSPASIKARADVAAAEKELAAALKEEIGFANYESEIKEDGLKVVAKVSAVLKKFPATGVTIHGHAKENNVQISQDRADAVAAALKADGCVNPIVTKGWGSSHPKLGEVAASDLPASHPLVLS